MSFELEFQSFYKPKKILMFLHRDLFLVCLNISYTIFSINNTVLIVLLVKNIRDIVFKSYLSIEPKTFWANAFKASFSLIPFCTLA